jgi:hypothetical protein
MSASLGFASGLRLGLPAGLGLTRGRLWVGHGHGQGIGRGVGSRLLMGRPGALYRLPGDFEVVDDLRPRPDRGALTRLRGVLDQLVQAWIAPAMTGRLDCQSSPPGSRGPTVCKRRPDVPLHKGSRLHRNPARPPVRTLRIRRSSRRPSWPLRCGPGSGSRKARSVPPALRQR